MNVKQHSKNSNLSNLPFLSPSKEGENLYLLAVSVTAVSAALIREEGKR